MSAPYQINLTFRPQHIRIDRLTEPHIDPQLDPPIGEPPKIITVTAGELLTLVCSAGPANPPVPLQWRQIACEDLSTDGNYSGVAPTDYAALQADTSKAPCSIVNSFGELFALINDVERFFSRC